MAIDASQLKIDLEEKEHWRRRLSVTVPANIVESERQKAAAKLASRLKLPGFRKGKIPTTVIEQRYGQALRQDRHQRPGEVVEGDRLLEPYVDQLFLPDVAQGEGSRQLELGARVIAAGVGERRPGAAQRPFPQTHQVQVGRVD